MIEYRKLERQDQEQVQSLMKEHALQFPPFIIDLYPERWSSYISNNDLSESEYWVAVHPEAGIVGHSGYIYNNKLKTYEIVGVVVSSKLKRKGVGRELLNLISSQIKERGHSKVVLFTLGHPENEGTLQFYKSIGYKETNYEKDYFSDGFSRVTFMINLE